MAKHKQIDEDFFKKQTSEMAYVLGFFAADGNMLKTRRGGMYISFYSSDRKLLEQIQKEMSSNHKLSKRKQGHVYRFQIGSKKIFGDLINLGFTPNKIKRMKFPKIQNFLLKDFIRGYFDGDGNIWSGLINKSRKTPTKVLQIAFTSGCREFLENLLLILKANGIKGGSIFNIKNKECSRLIFSTIDALKIYKIMYNPNSKLYLKRKKLIFEKFIKMRL